MRDSATITEMLSASREVGGEATERFMAAVYDELHRMAHWQRAAEGRNETLNTTALVHEAYARLVDGDRLPFEGRGHFFAAAATAMRRVLVDAARARNREKRGGGVQPEPITMSDEPPAEQADEHLLALDEALSRFAQFDPRGARVVECRHFAGLSVEETAEALDVSPVTVKRDWAAARAWLFRELSGG